MTSRLPSPPTRDVSPVSESHKLEHVRNFSPSTDVMQLLDALRREHVTGTITIDLAQGGVGSIHLRVERRLTFDDQK